MKLDKLYLCGNEANRVISKKMGFARPVPDSCLAIMYALQRKRTATNFSGFSNYVIRYRPTMNKGTVYNCMQILLKDGLVDKDSNGLYSLSLLGKEYLRRIRVYLLNIRL